MATATMRRGEIATLVQQPTGLEMGAHHDEVLDGPVFIESDEDSEIMSRVLDLKRVLGDNFTVWDPMRADNIHAAITNLGKLCLVKPDQNYTRNQTIAGEMGVIELLSELVGNGSPSQRSTACWCLGQLMAMHHEANANRVGASGAVEAAIENVRRGLSLTDADGNRTPDIALRQNDPDHVRQQSMYMVVFVTGYSPSSHERLLRLGVHKVSVLILEAAQMAQSNRGHRVHDQLVLFAVGNLSNFAYHPQNREALASTGASELLHHIARTANSEHSPASAALCCANLSGAKSPKMSKKVLEFVVKALKSSIRNEAFMGARYTPWKVAMGIRYLGMQPKNKSNLLKENVLEYLVQGFQSKMPHMTPRNREGCTLALTDLVLGSWKLEEKLPADVLGPVATKLLGAMQRLRWATATLTIRAHGGVVHLLSWDLLETIALELNCPRMVLRRSVASMRIINQHRVRKSTRDWPLTM